MADFDMFPKRFPPSDGTGPQDVTGHIVEIFRERIIKSYAPPAPFLSGAARVVLGSL